MKVEAKKFSDRLLLGFGSVSGAILLRSPEGEAFRFSGYGFIRRMGQSIIARGKFEAFRLGDSAWPVHRPVKRIA